MRLKKIFIDKRLKGKEEEFLFLPSNIEIDILYISEEEVESLEKELSYREAKDFLFFTEKKSGFTKKCPGTHNYICCEYAVLNIQEGCLFDCSYCILQGYLTRKIPRVYTNWEDIEKEIRGFLEKTNYKRIGPGELSDSLVYDPYTHYSKRLIELFKDFPDVVLEFKTKSVEIDNLLINGEVPPNVMVSWSVNTPRIIATEEHRAPSLADRLKAARMVYEKGYKVGFHFDPLFVYEGAEKEYLEVVDQIFTHVPPEAILYISIGVFRYLPFMKERILKSFPFTSIFKGEFREGLDGKMRYFRPLRERLVAKLIEHLKSYGKNLNLYFCMESNRWWEMFLGHSVLDNEEAKKIVDRGMKRSDYVEE